MSNHTEVLKQVLAKEGLRFTSQREEIWREILSNADHRNAEDIYLSLRSKKVDVSRATVYRTIDVLFRHNLVRKLDVGMGPSKFEKKVDTPHHDHIICTNCGKIVEFVVENIEQLQEEVAREYGFKLERHSHQLFGLCADCQ